MHDEAVLALLTSMEAISEEHHILNNGKHTLIWVDLVKVLQYPDIVKDFGEQIADLFFDVEFDVVVSASLTGMTIGQEVARNMEIKHIFAEEKNGEIMIRDSFEFEKGEKALLIDDVVASGYSIKEVAKLVKAKGASVKAMACVVDRAVADKKFKPVLKSLLAIRLPMVDVDECEVCTKRGQVYK